MGHQLEATAHVGASPEKVFGLVTDVSRLPEWNTGIVEIVEAPDRMVPGARWKVKVRALGTSWVSKSEATTVDAGAGRFAYRSQSDDGNPSYADWEWRIEPDGDGSQVTVAVDVNPKTFFRKVLAVRMRKPGLRKEMHASLGALASHV
jgi:uncharacterized protein YndB with AHSA1/START domain